MNISCKGKLIDLGIPEDDPRNPALVPEPEAKTTIVFKI